MKILAMIRRILMTLAVAVSPAYAETLAVVNGTVIDGTGSAPLKKGVVLIDNGRIRAVGSKREIAIPGGAELIDAKGKYVIPGLMDANLHLSVNVDTELLIKYEGRYHEAIQESAQITLKGGLTTVFDTWGPRAPLVKARDEINSGEVIGSRIFLAGNIIGFDGPYSPDFLGVFSPNTPSGIPKPYITDIFANRINELFVQGVGRELMWMGPDAVAEKVTEYATKEVDFLKYGASGHADMFFISFSPRVQKAIVDAGHKSGKTVQAHTTSIESFYMVVEAGADIITHCDDSGPNTPLPKSYIKKMVEQGVACSVTASTDARMAALEEASHPLVPRKTVSRENIRAMIEAGATLLLATDSGVKSPAILVEYAHLMINVDPEGEIRDAPHFNALVGFEDLGMAPMEILKSATSNIAKAYKVDDIVGTLEPGKMADMVILDKNPLKSARNYRTIHKVIKEGNVVDIDSLRVMIESGV